MVLKCYNPPQFWSSPCLCYRFGSSFTPPQFWGSAHKSNFFLASVHLLSAGGCFPQFYQPPLEEPPDLDLTQARADFQQLVAKHLRKRVTLNTIGGDVGLVLWRNQDKLNLHLINYDFDYHAKQSIEKNNLAVAMDAELSPQPSRIIMLSPDYHEPTELDFSVKDGVLSFTIPALHVWDIVVIE